MSREAAALPRKRASGRLSYGFVIRQRSLNALRIVAVT